MRALHTIPSSYCNIVEYTNAHGSTQNKHAFIPAFHKNQRHINASRWQTWVLPALPAIYSPQTKYFHCYCICRACRLASHWVAGKQLYATVEHLSKPSKLNALPLNVFNICTKCRNVFLKHPWLSSALCTRQLCEACNNMQPNARFLVRLYKAAILNIAGPTTGPKGLLFRG